LHITLFVSVLFVSLGIITSLKNQGKNTHQLVSKQRTTFFGGTEAAFLIFFSTFPPLHTLTSVAQYSKESP
jgi:hypothetical protein